MPMYETPPTFDYYRQFATAITSLAVPEARGGNSPTREQGRGAQRLAKGSPPGRRLRVGGLEQSCSVKLSPSAFRYERD